MKIFDTIAAISTPYGKGGIAVIRISGADAIHITDRVFIPASKKRLSDIGHGKSVYGGIYSSGVHVDDGLAVCFFAPHSFTGEDTVEISCHGGILVTQKVLEAVLMAGARLAEAGEFTRRAFVGGKMTLSSAEALASLLDAQSEEQIRVANAGMRGVLTDKTAEIYDKLCRILAGIYAKIDYPDEDLAEITREEMLGCLDDCIARLRQLADTYRTGHAVAEGIPAAIVGRTNAGKSSLYNRILGKNAAIVTDVEGTTRDILSENCMLGRVMLRLSDTAGIRESSDPVERIGIDRAKRELENDELIFAVFDGSAVCPEDLEIASLALSSPGVCVAVINKTDIATDDAISELEERFEYKVRLSAKTGEGFEDLVRTVEDIYINRQLDTGRDAMITNARQHTAVIEAMEALCNARQMIADDMPLEISCAATEHSMSLLGELDGRTVSEDIVNSIFSHFCVGK